MTSYTGRKVLVTGADGFIGSHLVESLVEAGAEVRAFCFYNSQGSWGWLDSATSETRSAIDVQLGDIRDRQVVFKACEGVEVVFHLAALIAIPYSYVAPQSFVETNVLGTLNLLEAARTLGVQRFVQTSTSEVYGTPTKLPIRESHPLNAQSPYAASKVASDQLTLAYYRSFGLPAVVLRPFNTYGPRQSTRAVLPTILLQLIEKKGEIELGRLDPRRDLTFISDTVEGFLRAGTAADVQGEVIQLGTGRCISVREMFDMSCKVVGVKARVREDVRRLRPDASEVLVLQSDPTRALELLGWKPKVDIEEGLGLTAQWLEHHRRSFRTDYLHV